MTPNPVFSTVPGRTPACCWYIPPVVHHIEWAPTIALLVVILLGLTAAWGVLGLVLHPLHAARHPDHKWNIGWSAWRGPWIGRRIGEHGFVSEDV